jgi:glycerol kinase
VNPVLMQFQADILGATVVVPSIVETTALGAAYLAGLAVGFWESTTDIADKWALDNRYRAHMDAPTRERLFRRWQKAVVLAKGWALDDD